MEGRSLEGKDRSEDIFVGNTEPQLFKVCEGDEGSFDKAEQSCAGVCGTGIAVHEAGQMGSPRIKDTLKEEDMSLSVRIVKPYVVVEFAFNIVKNGLRRYKHRKKIALVVDMTNDERVDF